MRTAPWLVRAGASALLAGFVVIAGCDSSAGLGGSDAGNGIGVGDTGNIGAGDVGGGIGGGDTLPGQDTTGGTKDTGTLSGDTGTVADTGNPGTDTAMPEPDVVAETPDTVVAKDTATPDDSGSPVDTGIEPDVAEGPVDAGNPDDVTTTNPDVVSSGCTAAQQCPIPDPGMPDVEIQTVSGMPAAMAGGSVPMGGYELTLAKIYPDSLGGGKPLAIELQIQSNGNTFGSAVFETSAWGVAANLDLALGIPLLGQSFTTEQQIGGGGCFTISGATLFSDLLECFEGDPMEVAIPDSFDYQTSPGKLELLVVIDKDTLLNAIPAQYQSIAKGFLVDDLQLVLEFTETN